MDSGVVVLGLYISTERITVLIQDSICSNPKIIYETVVLTCGTHRRKSTVSV